MKKTNDSVVVRAEAEIGDENELADTGAKPTTAGRKSWTFFFTKSRPHYLCVLFSRRLQGTNLLRRRLFL